MARKQRCPKCNYLNEIGASYCVQCRAPLIQICPICGTPRPWYVPRCPHCESNAADSTAFANLFHETPTQRLHGRYLVKSVIATTRTSTLYRAVNVQQQPSLTYAIKEFSYVALFRPDEHRQAESALDHATACWSAVEHPALPRIVETFKEHEKQYVVFEFVDGWSIQRIISARRVRATPDLVRNWGAQLCDLLGCLHEQTPPLHVPFLSPSHVMVDTHGRIKLVGLGLGRLFTPDASAAFGSVRGYSAPELADTGPTARTDAFALGRLLYALLTDRLLEKGLPRRLSLQRAVPGISGRLVKAVARAAHRSPDQRFASMADFRGALWDEQAGSLEPLDDWLQVAMSDSEAPSPEASQPISQSTPTMADMGFIPDPRFRSRQASAPTPRPPDQQPRISIYPHTFVEKALKAGEVRRIILTIRNKGDAELVGHVRSHVDWLRAPKKAIKLPAGRQAKVLLSIRAALLHTERAVEPRALSVETNAGTHWIGVTAEIAIGPLLQLDRSILDFGTFEHDAERSRSLIITNAGNQLLTGHVVSRMPWLQVPHGEFSCASGQSVKVSVRAKPSEPPKVPQAVLGALIIDSDGGQEQIEARALRIKPEMDLGATHMDFGLAKSGDVIERYLYMGNTGNGTLRGTARSLLPWLQVYPQEIICEPGELVQLTVTLDCVGLSDGILDVPQALRVQTNGGTRTLPLRLQVSAPMLSLETPNLDFGPVPLGETAKQELVIRNDGSAPLEATIHPLVNWLTVSTESVCCEPHREISIPVSAHAEMFEHGQRVSQSAAMRVISGSDVKEIPARIDVIQPALRVDPSEIDFSYIGRARPETQTMTIANEGTGNLAWNVQINALWVEVAPRSGVCEPGQTQELTLTAYGLALESDSQAAQATLIVNSDGGRAKVPLRVALESPLIATDTTFLDLGSSVNMEEVRGSFRIFNHGLGFLRGTINADQTWLVVDHASFECAMGRSVEVKASADMDEFPRGESRQSGAITIESNGGEASIETVVHLEFAPCIGVPECVHLSRSAPQAPLQGRLVVKNSGMATAHIALDSGPSQLELSRSICDIKPNKSARIIVQWQGAIQVAPTSLHIDIRADDGHIRVPVRLDKEPDISDQA